MERPRLTARKHQERPHVLIVSDDPSLVEFLTQGLPLGGFWTSVISSGLQALEVFRLRQFDLIVVDAGLRSFNPIEWIRRLRGFSTRTPGAQARTTAPVILVTDTPVSLSDADMIALDIDRICEAPLELHELVTALHEAFEVWRERYPSVPMSDDPLRE